MAGSKTKRNTEPEFSIGIEEEYLLVDQKSLDLAAAPSAMMKACDKQLKGQVSPEFLQCQIEVGTKVCKNVDEARQNLAHLRKTIKTIANDHGLAPIAASCHPFANWRNQRHTNKQRYHDLARDLGGVVERMLICGMHVHVGIGDDDDLRIDLMNQLSYFLPHLLALSTSSPFWQGRDSGLASYRLTVFDNLPRTGLPPRFDSYAQYQRSVHTIIDNGIIEDTSKIWWDLRPSACFATLETRICDVSPILDHTISIAAIIQALTRMLYRLRRSNQRWRQYASFLINENRWRAQRYGINEGLIDFGLGKIVPYSDLLEEIIELLNEDAKALGSLKALRGARNILRTGTSADRQRVIFARTKAKGADDHQALREVVRSLIKEFDKGI